MMRLKGLWFVSCRRFRVVGDWVCVSCYWRPAGTFDDACRMMGELKDGSEI